MDISEQEFEGETQQNIISILTGSSDKYLRNMLKNFLHSGYKIRCQFETCFVVVEWQGF